MFSNAGALEVPGFVKYIIYCLSGIGVLWYIQLLWIFSLVLALIKTIDKDRFWKVCSKTPFWVILLLCIPVYFAGQILNTPIPIWGACSSEQRDMMSNKGKGVL